MDFAAAADRASKLWTTFPALRCAFVDVSALTQTLIDRNPQLAAERDADCALIASRCVAGAERLALVRNPIFAPPQSSFIERTGRALVIWVYGPLTAGTDPDGGCSGYAIAAALRANADADALILRIASHGGRTAALTAVLNALAHFKGRTIAIVDFFAISAAADLACAADRLVMRENAVLRLHSSQTTTAGTATHLTSVAQELRTLDDHFAARIARKRRIQFDVVRQVIHEDRYLSASEAHALGLCNSITRSLDGAAPIIAKETDHAG